MKVVTLLENEKISPEFKNKHGLSMYIETQNRKILFDTGPDKSFALNADKLGVKIEDVEALIISHGHFDHAGGLKEFLKRNTQAKIYIHKDAFQDYYYEILGIYKLYIGVSKSIKPDERFVLVEDTTEIFEGITIFGDASTDVLFPKGNEKLYKKSSSKKKYVNEDFTHEIYLTVKENDKYTLFSGCSHKGLVNIINRAQEILGGKIHNVFGGMHLMEIKALSSDNSSCLDDLAAKLKDTQTERLFTCHCTGRTAYNYLETKMDNLDWVKTGSVVEV